jgi:hypothetical protein
MLTQSHPERAAKLMDLAKMDVVKQWEKYSQLAGTNGKGK